MTYINTKDPNVSFYLVPWFVCVNQDKIEIGAELHRRLLEEPDDTYVEIAVENNQVHGFIAAFIDGNSVFIWQVNADDKVDIQKGLERLIDWAEMKGVYRLTTISLRDRSLIRKYGFKRENDLLVKEI
jgi:hypothetical protein